MTLACGGAYTPFKAAQPNDQKKSPVEKRAEKVPKHNLAAARDLNQMFTTRNVTKRSRLKPNSYSSAQRAGVVGLALGAFGEVPSSCHSLCQTLLGMSKALSSFRNLGVAPLMVLALAGWVAV
jgi:hypothetical protein